MNQLVAMWVPGWTEIVIIAFVGLLIFGRRLPEVGRSLGRSIVEFKKGVREAKNEIDKGTSLDDEPPRRLPPQQSPPPRTVESTPVSEPSEPARGDSG
ncbi:MAG: twin-arginine translocase TatA/TatE family subunit [Phycisphaerales bacterium]|nr:MAG: twin-arginine translocase TatA/TatE family subunit [Phycisphaerales bacterium]